MQVPSDVSPAFETYWHFAAERQAIYQRRLADASPPWTTDPILRSYRFTNVYRASDRVSQYLIREVLYTGDQAPAEVLFRLLLFRFFNRVSTWELLVAELGFPRARDFDLCRAERLLSAARAEGRRVYSAAYIVPPVPGRAAPKHAGHLWLAMTAVESGLAELAVAADSLQELFVLLRGLPGVGDFIAYQIAIDLCYSLVVDHDEDDFVIAGPGARDGISKVFPGIDLRRAEDVIREFTDNQEKWFTHFGLEFSGLFGRRLHLIDVQNLFCEISKYSRVAHPELPGVAGRTRIKQSFRPAGRIPPPFFPPSWELCPDRYRGFDNVQPAGGAGGGGPS